MSVCECAGAGKCDYLFKCYAKHMIADIYRTWSLPDIQALLHLISSYQEPAVQSFEELKGKTCSDEVLNQLHKRNRHQLLQKQCANKVKTTKIRKVDEQSNKVAEVFLKAALDGNLSVIQALALSFDRETINMATWWASSKGHLAIVEWLLCHAYVDPNVTINWHSCNTLLTIACFHGRLNVVEYLVENCQVDVNQHEISGRTPLLAACDSGQLEVVMYLLNNVRQLDIDAIDDYRNNALHHVIMKYKNSGWTRLHRACWEGNVTEVERLLYCEDDINEQTNSDETALHLVCQKGNEQLADVLIWSGIDTTIVNIKSETAADVAGVYGYHWLSEVINKNCLTNEEIEWWPSYFPFFTSLIDTGSSDTRIQIPIGA